MDIETLPPDEATWKVVRATVEDGVESKYKRQETIDARKEAAYRDCSLKGDFGRILCVGWILEDNGGEIVAEGVFGWDEEKACFTLDERRTLEEFWALVQRYGLEDGLIVGHNVFNFDLKFILQRSVVHGVRPTAEWWFGRYRNNPIYDTMMEWSKWDMRDFVSLGRLAVALGLPSSKSDEVSGDKVYDLFLDGRHEVIKDYCLADVRLTRHIYHRLMFSMTTAASVANAS